MTYSRYITYVRILALFRGLAKANFTIYAIIYPREWRDKERCVNTLLTSTVLELIRCSARAIFGVYAAMHADIYARKRDGKGRYGLDSSRTSKSPYTPFGPQGLHSRCEHETLGSRAKEGFIYNVVVRLPYKVPLFCFVFFRIWAKKIRQKYFFRISTARKLEESRGG